MGKNVQEAERAVIAALLSGEGCEDEIMTECTADMFADADCRQVFLTALTIYERQRALDLVTVTTESEKEFAPRVIEMSNAFFVGANLDRYMETVREAWQFRTCAAGLQRCLEKAREHDGSCFEELDRLRERITGTGPELHPVSELCKNTLDMLTSLSEKERGISTGFPSLDRSIGGGLVPGRLFVIGGRPGMGKSALALDMALEACKHGAVTVYITLEMTKDELLRRAVCYLGGISEATMKEKGEQALDTIREANDLLSRQKLYIEDSGDCSLAAVEGMCRRALVKEGRLDLVVIDYVGLMRTNRTKTSTRQQEIAEISRGLKRLAVRLPTTVLLLSQLNREADARPGLSPRLSDLRECGDLEQDADVVLFSVRRVNTDTGAPEGEAAALYVAKNRSGSPCRIDMHWRGGVYMFREALPLS